MLLRIIKYYGKKLIIKELKKSYKFFNIQKIYLKQSITIKKVENMNFIYKTKNLTKITVFLYKQKNLLEKREKIVYNTIKN